MVDPAPGAEQGATSCVPRGLYCVVRSWSMYPLPSYPISHACLDVLYPAYDPIELLFQLGKAVRLIPSTREHSTTIKSTVPLWSQLPLQPVHCTPHLRNSKLGQVGCKLSILASGPDSVSSFACNCRRLGRRVCSSVSYVFS